MAAPPMGSVAVIGGGWAGLACALKLAQAGYAPVVFESAPEPGGRARRAFVEGIDRDNGQHLMLGGCQSWHALFKAAGIQLNAAPFQFQSGTRQLMVPAKPGRMGLAIALLRAHGFSWYERYRLVCALGRLQANGWRVAQKQTVADWLQQTKQPARLINDFWAPLALAILNTPLHQAAMCRLAPVLRDTLGQGGKALTLLQPQSNLSETIVNPVVFAIKNAGGSIRSGERVIGVEPTASGYQLMLNDSSLEFDQVVLAIPPWALNHLTLPTALNSSNWAALFGSQPIATVYLGFEAGFRLPAPLLQIAGPMPDDSRVWAMDRSHCGEPGVVAISLSADGPWHTLSGDALTQACYKALQQAVENLPPCLWQRTITVQRATYAATPQAFLSSADLMPLPCLHLAGDWTHINYPATLEAAVSSGFAAADRIMQSET
ncbi:MAG: hydroxysqualene dehydroxylase HpnE [Fluviibacter sp.]